MIIFCITRLFSVQKMKHRIPILFEVDRNLHVKLHHKNSSVPLPSWFRDAVCKITRLSMLENFAAYIRNIADTIPTKILDEMKEKVYCNVKGRGNYSSEVVRLALMQRYTSRQAYSLLLNEFPLPSLSCLRQFLMQSVLMQ